MNKRIAGITVRQTAGRLGALWLLLAVLVAGAAPAPAWAFPQMPHQFCGDVTINGSLAASGVIVSARIGGVEYASTTTDSQGRYGYTPSLFMVPADDPATPPKEGGSAGDTVSFYVAGVLGGTAPFACGQVTNLNPVVALTVPRSTPPRPHQLPPLRLP